MKINKTHTLIIICLTMVASIVLSGCHNGDKAAYDQAVKQQEAGGAVVLSKSPVGNTPTGHITKMSVGGTKH